MNTWTLIDTETDGLYSPIYVIEIAAQRFDGLEPSGDPFQIFLNHQIEIPPDATAIHGYTTDFISQHGDNPHDAYAQLRNYVGDDPIVAHYLRFDWNRALIPELARLGESPIGSKGFCSWDLSRRCLPEHPSHRLDYLRRQYDLECSRAHTALGDVESVCDLLTRIIFPRLADFGFSSLDGIHEFMAIRPLLKCRCLMQGLDYEEEARRIAETRERKRKFEEFIWLVEGGQYPIPSLILDFNLIEEDPEIRFKGSTFLFTGKMAWGSRSEAKSQIEDRGGSVSKSKTVTKEIDYLVLGEDPEKGWTSLIHGGKLTKAFLKRFKEPNLPYRIVREMDFIAALRNNH